MAPMYRERRKPGTLVDLEFISLRHVVFTIQPWSADHVTKIIYEQSTPEERNQWSMARATAAKHRTHTERAILNAFHERIEGARRQWSIQLRDQQLRDVDITVSGNWATCTKRFKDVKDALEKMGGRFYFLHLYDRESGTIRAGVVAKEECIRRIHMKEHDFDWVDNTPPAPEDAGNLEHKGPQSDLDIPFWHHDQNSKPVALRTAVDHARAQPFTALQELRDAPMVKQTPWNVYTSKRPLARAHPVWAVDEQPFTKDLCDPRSNNNWVERDHALRRQQLKEYQERSRAIKAKRQSPWLPAAEPAVSGVDFAVMDELSQTYTEDRDLHYFAENVLPAMEKETKQQECVVTDKFQRWQEAKDIYRNMQEKEPGHEEALKFYAKEIRTRKESLDREEHSLAILRDDLRGATKTPLPTIRSRASRMGVQAQAVPKYNKDQRNEVHAKRNREDDRAKKTDARETVQVKPFLKDANKSPTESQRDLTGHKRHEAKEKAINMPNRAHWIVPHVKSIVAPGVFEGDFQDEGRFMLGRIFDVDNLIKQQRKEKKVGVLRRVFCSFLFREPGFLGRC